MAVREDIPEELAYKLTKIMLEKREDLAKVHKEALNIKVENQKAANARHPLASGRPEVFRREGHQGRVRPRQQ